MTRTERLVAHFRRERSWTRSLVAAVPEERFDWAPAPDEFSCGGVVVHLIHAEVFWRRLLVAAAAGDAYDPFRLAGEMTERYAAFRPRNFESSRTARFGSTFAEILAVWTPIEEETASALAAIPEERLLSATVRHPVAGLSTSLEDMFLTFFSHESHHRGQLSAYLKMLRCPQPPLFTEGP